MNTTDLQNSDLSLEKVNTPVANLPERAPNRPFRTPSYHVLSQEDGSHEISVNLPGVAKSNIEIQFENRQLTVTAPRSDDQSPDWEPLSRGLNRDPYLLKLQIHKPIHAEEIKATHENGVLKLHLPLAKKAQTRQIQIS